MEDLKKKSEEIVNQGKYLLDSSRRALEIQNRVMLAHLGVGPDDLQKLNRIPLITGIVGLLINVLLLCSRYQTAWLSGNSLYNGQPLEVHASLNYVIFGEHGEDTAIATGPCHSGANCGLHELCLFGAAEGTYANGAPKFTNPEVWCQLRDAGNAAQGLLWIGFIPGLIATIVTLLYAAREIPKVAMMYKKVDDILPESMQRMALAGSWAVLWLFLFISMAVYASSVPKSLGIGPVKFDASFGMLQMGFLLTTIFGSLLIASLFELWTSANVAEAWAEFSETKLFTPKKALYLELMAQMCLYMLMSLKSIQWEMLLVIICGYYLDAKVRNFMLMYVAFVSMSLLFDVVNIASMNAYDTMTAGEQFSSTIFIVIFLLKFCILGTIYFYERDLDSHPEGYFRHSIEDGEVPGQAAPSREDEIAE